MGLRTFTLVHAVMLLACVLTPRHAAAQQVYKWTDSQGQVHYSDHAESGQQVATVSVPKSPVKAPTRADAQMPVAEQMPVDALQPEPIPHRAAQVAPALDPIVARNMQGQSRLEAAAKQKAADQALVAKCKSNRDSFCNDVGEIKRQQQILNEPPSARYRCHYSYGMHQECDWVAPPPPPKPEPRPQPHWNGRQWVTPVKKPAKKSDDD